MYIYVHYQREFVSDICREENSVFPLVKDRPPLIYIVSYKHDAVRNLSATEAL